MVQDVFILVALAFIAVCGARCAERAFGIKVFGVALTVGLPLGMAIFVLLATALRPLLSPVASTIGGAAGLLMFTLSFNIRRLLHRPTQELPPPDAPEPFGRCTLGAIGIVLLLALLALRLGQLSALPPDFCTNYPFFRALLLNGNNLQAPFFPDQTYAGCLPYAILIASFSLVANGDVLRSEWILQAVLLLDAIVIWTLTLRFFLRRALPAALATALLFGSALTPSFAHQTTLCYANLLNTAVIGALVNSFLTLMRYNRQHKETPPLAGLTVGALTMFCALLSPLVTLLLWLSLWMLSALYALRRNANASVLGRSALAISLYSALWGASQFLCWNQATELWHQGYLTWLHINPHFLRITLPADALELTTRSGVSLFSWPSLSSHAPVFFLGLPMLAWALWRRSRKGTLLWVAAIFFFLWPGLFEGITQPWRCELLSDSLMAILLGYALGDVYQLWSRQRSRVSGLVQRAVLVCILIGLTTGFWSSIAKTYRNYPCPQERISHAFLPWYPNTRQWLSSVPQVELSPAQTAMAEFLWNHQERPLRTLFASPDLTTMSWANLALWAGQSGTIPVGFTSPHTSLGAADQQDSLTDIYRGFSSKNIALPAPATLAFLQQPRQDVLLGLGTELLVSAPIVLADLDLFYTVDAPQNHSTTNGSAVDAPLTHSTADGAPSYTSAKEELCAYRLSSDFPWRQKLLPYPNPKISISVSQVPDLAQRSSGVAYNIKIHANTNLCGWLWPQWQDAQTNAPLAQAPLTLFVEGKDADVPLVFPYPSGDYTLNWLYCPQEKLRNVTPDDLPQDDPYVPLTVERLTGTTELNQQFSTTLEKNLRLVKVEQITPRAGLAVLKNIGDTQLACGSNLRLQWQVWSPLQHGYIHSMNCQETILPLPLKPGASTTIRWQCAYDVSSQDRIDFNVGPHFGAMYPVIRQ